MNPVTQVLTSRQGTRRRGSARPSLKAQGSQRRPVEAWPGRRHLRYGVNSRFNAPRYLVGLTLRSWGSNSSGEKGHEGQDSGRTHFEVEGGWAMPRCGFVESGIEDVLQRLG